MSNQGETIDDNFFVRLNSFENYYEKNSQQDDTFYPNYEATIRINQILQKELLSLEEIQKAIDIYNEVNLKPHHDGSGWFDLRLHLRHIAFVYGKELITDNNFNLIEKEH